MNTLVKNLRCIIVSITLLYTIITSSCSPIAPVTQEELLAGKISKRWIAIKIIDSNDTDVTNFFSSFKFQFNRDGSFIYTATRFGTNFVDSTADKWKLEGTQLTFAIPEPPSPGRITVTVYELTEKSLSFGIPNNAFNKLKMDFKAE